MTHRPSVREVTQMQANIATDRLALRPLAERDLESLFALNSDPEVMRFVNGGIPMSLSELELVELPGLLESAANGNGYGFFVATSRLDGRFIGWFHLRPDKGDPADEPELGYRLTRSSWGAGLATEGAKALVRHAFTDLGATRVTARCMVVHRASRRVMEKAGLSLVRTYHAEWPVRIPGDEYGDVEYAIDRKTWLALDEQGTTGMPVRTPGPVVGPEGIEPSTEGL